MPSSFEPAFVTPSLLAGIVRKNRLACIDQLTMAIAALGFRTSDLASKVRASLRTMLAQPGTDFKSESIVAHPVAVNSWRLAWESRRERTGLRALQLEDEIQQDWRRHNRRGCCGMPVVYHMVPDDCERLFDFSEYNSAMLLRTSLWIDLLKRDPEAAKSWQRFELGGFYHRDWVGATYLNSNRRTMLVGILTCIGNWPGCLDTVTTLATRKDWDVEVYSPSFDTVNRRREKNPCGYLIDFFKDDW